MTLSWLCPNAMTGIGGPKHDATAERTAPGEWRIRCSCGYQARASSGEVAEAERRAANRPEIPEGSP